MKAKQIEVLIQSLPVPEPEEQQVPRTLKCVTLWFSPLQANRLQALENGITEANQEYTQAVDRASTFSYLLSFSLRPSQCTREFAQPIFRTLAHHAR